MHKIEMPGETGRNGEYYGERDRFKEFYRADY